MWMPPLICFLYTWLAALLHDWIREVNGKVDDRIMTLDFFKTNEAFLKATTKHGSNLFKKLKKSFKTSIQSFYTL